MVCSVNNSYGTWSLWKRESGILEICHPGSQLFQMLFVKTHWLSFIFSLFGDEAETVFWEVALHYLRREKSRILCLKHQVTYSRTGCSISLPEMKTVRLNFFTSMLMLVFFTFLNWHNWKMLHGTDRMYLCEKKWRHLIPRPSLFEQKSWEDEKKTPHIQVILGLTKTAKFVEIYCPLVNMCSVLLVYYSLIFLRLNTSPRTLVVQGHSQLTSLIHLNPRPKSNEATVPGAWIYYQ